MVDGCIVLVGVGAGTGALGDDGDEWWEMIWGWEIGVECIPAILG